MQQKQTNKPIAVNLDKSKKYLTPTEAFYMLNRERNINGTGTLGKTTPLVANYLACTIEQPAGDNYGNGYCFSEETNELYWWTYNTNGVNYIARLNGDGTCQIVYDGDCLPLSAAPEHSIESWRCYLKYDRYCANQHGKQLIWTNGDAEIGQLDVEASIATDSFRTPFFTDYCPDPCAYTEMCVPEPCGPLEGEFVALAADQLDLTNKILDVGIKVAFFHIYYDQRESTMSDISTLYYQDSKGCFDIGEGLPRCIKFTVPLGNPMVDKIEIVFSTDNGVTWKSSDIIEKYQPYSNSTQYWYERDLADLADLDLNTCTFSYNFCNDKECNPISPERASRVFNPMPRKPQGLIRIKNALGFYNYIEGNCPIDGSEIEKFEVAINCTPDNCVEEMATVTVFAVVHNMLLNKNGFVFRKEGSNVDDKDDENDPARFQAIRSMNATEPIPFAMDSYGQIFKGKTRNFIAYVEGTSYWAQMVQYKSARNFVNRSKVGILSGMATKAIAVQVSSEIDSGAFYYQQFELKVPKGTKGFIRLASHLAENGVPGEGQDTSTFLLGTLPDIRLYAGPNNISGQVSAYAEELYFDTCSGDQTLYTPFVIDDNHIPWQQGSHTSSAYAGYLTDANNVPIEGADIWYNGSRYAITDHNGFYHLYVYGNANKKTITLNVYVEGGCVGGFSLKKNVTIVGDYGVLTQVDIQLSETDFPGYVDGYFETVNVALVDCNSLPVGGIRIALSGSKYQVTDSVTGIATFEVRNYSTRARSVRGVVMDFNNCFTLDCSDGCNPCMPSTANTLLPACFPSTPNTTNVSTSTNLNKEPALITKKGLKAGGRYPWAVVVKGSCGRISSAYPITVMNGSLPTGDNYMNIPKTQEKDLLSFCSFDYLATGMTLPDWAECVAICRGENVNNYELQWVIDKIERTADRKIKLTIQSLNDYNATYNFETNTLYQYIKDDRVEFINNGDGSIFDIATYGLLNYQILSPFHDRIVSGQTDAPADFFNQILINDDGKLDDLTIGAKIELQRPKTCTEKPTYYEVAHLDVIEISGQKMLAAPSGNFTTFDTYFVTRQIENANPLESNPPQQFEHKFPSDFWGHQATQGFFLGISDIGKPHFTNPFENEKRVGRNITVNSETRFNRFGNLVKTLDAPEQGDVIAMGIYDGKIGLGIGEFDSFLFQVSDEFLVVGPSGLVQAAPADALVSDTQAKISGIFGCRYQSIGSIFFGDGFVTWIDIAKSAYVKHDFNIAKDISQGKFNTWVKKTVQFMENFNRTTATDVEKMRFCTAMNYHTGALQLTAKALNQSGINNEQQPYISHKSTLLIEPNAEELLTFASYTPEGYGNIVLNNSTGCAFVSFYNGVPYIHPIIPIKYNEFFGTAVDAIIGVAINQNPEKIKRPTSIEIQSESRFYVLSVKVDDTNFDSFIPPIRVKKTEDKWNADFLCNMNARGGIYGTDPNVAGQKPRGYFCAVTFIRDNTLNLAWNTTDDTKRVAFDELDLILFKYQDSEQSGFSGNV